MKYEIDGVSKILDHEIIGFYSDVLDKEDIYKEFEQEKELFFVNEGAKYMNQMK